MWLGNLGLFVPTVTAAQQHQCRFSDNKFSFGSFVCTLLSACPTSCACGHDFTVEHSISCPKGGFPSLRHNELEVHDLTVNDYDVKKYDVSAEPLQLLSGETLCYQTTNSDPKVCLDIAANGF